MIEVDLLIRQGRLIDPANNVDGSRDIAIVGDRIELVAEHIPDCQASIEIDAQGQWIIPGIIDMAVRMREPGASQKATIASETTAAIAGGITSALIPPDTQPVIDTPAQVELLRRKGKDASCCWISPIGALTKGLDGQELAELHALKSAGCRAVSNAQRPIADSRVLLNALSYAATYDLTVIIQAADAWLSDGLIHQGRISSRLGLPGIPEAAETTEVARVLALAKTAGARVHFGRLSTAHAVEQIADAKKHGQKVSADVAIHQLFFTDKDLYDFNAQCHVQPPFRTEADREALIWGVNNGHIDAICSDHQPHESDAKNRPFGETEPGISGLDSLLALSARLIEDNRLNPSQIVQALSTRPAQILGLDSLGHLAPGARANLAIIDPDHPWQLRPDSMHSQGKNSPWLNAYFKHKVTHTLYEGRLVHGPDTTANP